VWAAFLVPALGALVSIVGVVGMATVGDRPYLGAPSSWHVWIVGIAGLVIGSGLFAIATWRVDALPRRGATLLAIGAVMVLPVLVSIGGGPIAEWLGRIVTVLAMAAFGTGWIVLGIGALRQGRAVSIAPPGSQTR
jgi:hypothetical protein